MKKATMSVHLPFVWLMRDKVCRLNLYALKYLMHQPIRIKDDLTAFRFIQKKANLKLDDFDYTIYWYFCKL